MLHYSDNRKISNYKIYMDTNFKIRELKEKIEDLQNYIEDFVNSHQAKKNKVANLESEIKDIKQNMNKYLDDLEKLINQK